MTPTDKAAIEGLLEAIQFSKEARQRMLTVPGGTDDKDYNADGELLKIVHQCVPALQRLLAGETREADKPAGVPVEKLEKLVKYYKDKYEQGWLAEHPLDIAKRIESLLSSHQDPHHG